MGKRLDGKVALITGVAGGIGRAIARLFTQEGANLLLSDLPAEFEGMPPSATYLAGDVTNESYVRSLIGAADLKYGRLDVLVNVHGVDYHSDLADTPLVEASRVIEVNLLGALTTMKYALPLMTRGGGGSIVNIASRLGQIAIPGQAVYSASKGGLIMLSRGAAIDYAPKNIRVNCVSPGITATSMIQLWVDSQPNPTAFQEELVASIPLRRMATPQDVAYAVLFLSSDESAYITGAVLPVDGGYTAA